MGRPRVYDETTRRALLGAAEAIVEHGGAGALSVRAVADATGTTTRAVYNGFGSKEGLLHALAQRSFEILRDNLAALPTSEDPARDLVDAALTVFRPMAIEHPSMFALAFLRAAPSLSFDEATRSASIEGYDLLRGRVQRLADAGLLGGRTVDAATVEFNAMCQGLATTELLNPLLLDGDPERVWRAAFRTLLDGFRTPLGSGRATGTKR